MPFLTVLVVRIALLPVIQPLPPMIHDEFSYLLAADTFASFRLTNPPHPLWQHFETVHDIMQPTYMSKYPPGQGMALAFGQVVFGWPWVGVLLTMALFCGLLPWAMRPWIPATWALFGGLIATLRIGIISYWTETYWGGGVAALGGTLALGAVGRLCRHPTARMAAVYVLGLGIVANSRAEGAVVLFLVYGACLVWYWFGGDRWKTAWPSYPMRALPGACAAGLMVLLFMGYYNYRITGSPLVLPYRVHESQYAVMTPFMWQQHPSPVPAYRHEFLRRYWVDWDGDLRIDQRFHYFHQRLRDFGLMVHFYFGQIFVPGVLLIAPALGLGRRHRVVYVMLGGCYAFTLLMSEFFPHYTAPAAALVFLGTTAALRSLWHFAPWRVSMGKWEVAGLVVVLIPLTIFSWPKLNTRALFPRPEYLAKREAVLAALAQQPGWQLVLVRYGPKSNPHDIWTYNRADIDDAQIVWVNAMTPAEDREILDYYAPQRRTIWLLDNDDYLTLIRYDDPEAEPLFRVRNLPENDSAPPAYIK